MTATPPQGDTLYTAFNVDAYGRNARGRIAVDQDAVAAQPFDPITAADLAFLWRLDSAGLSETRAMLASWTSNEARITAFIATWSYERMWLGWAVRDLLDAIGPRPEPRSRQRLSARIRDVWVERLMPLVVPPVSAAIGEATSAGHMIRMGLQEVSLQAAYAELLPRLTGEARRVVEEIIERRTAFIDFYRHEASARIARSHAEALSAKLAVMGWQPLRIVGVPDPDEPRALGNIFLGDGAKARLHEAQRPLRDLLRGVGLEPGTGPDGGPPPPPTPGLFSRKTRHGI
ncbi:hypothetical protein [Tessaracoccus caeni]|uniref:hypothetical protein n=1 Tax=Tessaracoccus caeni TaxID=3031239 RepID=UPI0023DCC2C8|nr:hypothetical protein [Tessaracoccus caeni]MDF1488565.1 hypothetical protein [Tessaracoccus caeni]